MTIDTAIIVAIISAVVAILGNILPKMFSRRADRAKAYSDEGDAAAKLSAAAAQQVQTYADEIVVPLRERIDVLEGENRALIEMRRSYDLQIENLQIQVRSLGRSLDTQREQILILIEQSASKDRTIRQMQQEIEQLRLENEALRKEVFQLRKENDLLRGDDDE